MLSQQDLLAQLESFTLDTSELSRACAVFRLAMQAAAPQIAVVTKEFIEAHEAAQRVWTDFLRREFDAHQRG